MAFNYFDRLLVVAHRIQNDHRMQRGLEMCLKNSKKGLENARSLAVSQNIGTKVRAAVYEQNIFSNVVMG